MVLIVEVFLYCIFCVGVECLHLVRLYIQVAFLVSTYFILVSAQFLFIV